MMKKLTQTLFISALSLGVAAQVMAGEISDRVEKTKTLLIGTEGTYAPFTFHDDSGKLTGFDVEVITEVAKRLGLTPEFKETQWDSMYAGLNAKRFDIIANQTTPTPERLKKYIFSTPYNYSSSVVVVKQDNDSIQSFADLKGKKAAQSLTSNFGKAAKEAGAEIIVADGLAPSLKLITQGRVETTVNDQLAVLDYFQKQPHSGLKIAFRNNERIPTAFAVIKDEEPLVEKLNQGLEAIRKDGTLKQISLKWFGDDVTQ